MVKKFYMETKKGTLEQAVLDVWTEAAKETDEGALKGAVVGGLVGGPVGAAAGAVIGKRRRMKGKDKFSRKALDKQSGGGQLSKRKAKAAGARKATLVKKHGPQKEQSETEYDEYNEIEQLETEHGAGEHAFEIGTDRYAEYTELVTPGQGQTNESLVDTIKNLWIEAASSAVDPKDREELDDAPGDTAKKMKRATEPKPMVATEALTAKQKKIDVDGDGEIEGSDLAKLRKKGAKKEDAEVEEELTIPQAQEFKVSSMRHALAKVWGLEEGELPPALKKAIDAKKKDKEDKAEDHDEDEENVKKEKTLTGKKMAKVSLDPKLATSAMK